MISCPICELGTCDCQLDYVERITDLEVKLSKLNSAGHRLLLTLSDFYWSDTGTAARAVKAQDEFFKVLIETTPK